MKFYFCVNSRAYFTNIFFTQEILYMNKEKKIPGHILSLFIILLSISGICLLMYKAQFRFNLHQPIEYVMMTTHKPTGTITYHNLVLGFPHSYRDVYLYSSWVKDVYNHIQGIQERYFPPLAPCCWFILKTDPVLTRKIDPPTAVAMSK